MQRRRFPLQSLREVTIVPDYIPEVRFQKFDFHTQLPRSVSHIRMHMDAFFQWFRRVNESECDQRLAQLEHFSEVTLMVTAIPWTLARSLFDPIGPVGLSLFSFEIESFDKDFALFEVARVLFEHFFRSSFEKGIDCSRLPVSMPDFRFVREATYSVLSLTSLNPVVRFNAGFVVCVKGDKLLELLLSNLNGESRVIGTDFFFQQLLTYLEFRWDNPFSSWALWASKFPGRTTLDPFGFFHFLEKLRGFDGKVRVSEPMIEERFLDSDIIDLCSFYIPNAIEIVGDRSRCIKRLT